MYGAVRRVWQSTGRHMPSGESPRKNTYLLWDVEAPASALAR